MLQSLSVNSRAKFHNRQLKLHTIYVVSVILQCQLEMIWVVVCTFIVYSFAPATRYSHWMRNQGQFIVKMILAYAPIRDIHTAYQLNRASNDDVHSACVTVKQLKFAIDSIFAIWQKKNCRRKKNQAIWIESNRNSCCRNVDNTHMSCNSSAIVTHRLKSRQTNIHFKWDAFIWDNNYITSTDYFNICQKLCWPAKRLFDSHLNETHFLLLLLRFKSNWRMLFVSFFIISLPFSMSLMQRELKYNSIQMKHYYPHMRRHCVRLTFMWGEERETSRRRVNKILWIFIFI